MQFSYRVIRISGEGFKSMTVGRILRWLLRNTFLGQEVDEIAVDHQFGGLMRVRLSNIMNKPRQSATGLWRAHLKRQRLARCELVRGCPTKVQVRDDVEMRPCQASL